MAKNKTLLKTLIILSLIASIGTGIYLYKNAILNKQLAKIDFGCKAPISIQPYWPHSNQAIDDRLTQLKEQQNNLTKKINIMLKEAAEQTRQGKNKNGYYRIRDFKHLKNERYQLRKQIAQTKLMKKGNMSTLERFAHKHNLFFKREILKRFPENAHEINSIIKIIEHTDIYTDKRILHIKFYNRTTAWIKTGVEYDIKSGKGEALTFRRRYGHWILVDKKHWNVK
ncbi:MAG: hypothetical protein PF904_01640 [Kiritimatiellae bacterium]|jgi:hypothetical protein|nr:hypothetical protein [Kiritimatiellia bacterium]